MPPGKDENYRQQVCQLEQDNSRTLNDLRSGIAHDDSDDTLDQRQQAYSDPVVDRLPGDGIDWRIR